MHAWCLIVLLFAPNHLFDSFDLQLFVLLVSSGVTPALLLLLDDEDVFEDAADSTEVDLEAATRCFFDVRFAPGFAFPAAGLPMNTEGNTDRILSCLLSTDTCRTEPYAQHAGTPDAG